jgi:hypothetical protein
MVFTTYGRERIALMLGSDLTNNFISYFNVGTSGTAESVSNTRLGSEFTRIAITGSPDFTTSRKVSFRGDLNSFQASGLNLKEFGFLASGLALTGSNWSREVLTNNVNFDGSLELILDYTIEVM